MVVTWWNHTAILLAQGGVLYSSVWMRSNCWTWRGKRPAMSPCSIMQRNSLVYLSGISWNKWHGSGGRGEKERRWMKREIMGNNIKIRGEKKRQWEKRNAALQTKWAAFWFPMCIRACVCVCIHSHKFVCDWSERSNSGRVKEEMERMKSSWVEEAADRGTLGNLYLLNIWSCLSPLI